MRKSISGHLHYIILLAGIIALMIPASVFAEDSVDYTQAAAIEDTQEILNELPSAEDISSGEGSRFLTRRLIVLTSEAVETYGAVNEWQTGENEIVLEYETEEAAQTAYKALKKKYRCYPDEVLNIETSGDLSDTSLGMSALKSSPLQNDVTVAVLDTGINKSSSFFTKGGKSGGRVSGSSYDFIRDTAAVSDPEGHGTDVAGVVAMNTPENVTILSCTVLDQANNSSNTKMSTLLLIGSALRYAQAEGADVINMSFDLEPVSGSSSSLDYLNDIIDDAYANGVICTVASGNDGRQLSDSTYPACLGSAVTVGSVNSKGERSGFSNYGAQLDFVAPGELSEPHVSGTSFSAPCIAACFAYLKGRDPELSSSALIGELRELCTDLGDPGKDDQYGWGLPDMSCLSKDTEHHYGKTIVKPATCTEDGLAQYKCTDTGCDASYEKAIPASGHTWKAVNDSSGLHLECINKGCTARTSAEELSGTMGSGSSAFSWEIVNGGTNSSNMPVARLEITGQGALPEQTAYPWAVFSDYITAVVLSDKITALPANAFSGMKSLVSVEYTDSMTDGRRYNGFSPSLTSIGQKAFFNCDALRSVTIGSCVSQIGTGAFSGCDSLRSISVADGNRSFMAEAGSLYSKNGTRLLLCTGSGIRSTVQSIDEYALYGSSITSVEIPASVSKIGSEAFSGCKALKSITFSGSGQITIGENAFRDVNSDVYYPESAAGASWAGGNYGGTLRWHGSNLYEGNAEITLSQKEYPYTGEPVIPEVIVRIKGQETPLVEGTDYYVSCSNNVSPGTASVSIIGTDKGYSGIITASFTIEKASFTFRKLEVPETVHAGETVNVKYDGRTVTDIPELELHYTSNPDSLMYTENDASGRIVLVAGKPGTGTLTVTADSNDFYEADLAKKYSVTVIPCAEDAHKWDEGKVVTQPTYAAAGLKRFTCTACGKTRDAEIAKLTGAAEGTSHKSGAFTYKVKSSGSVELIKAPNRKKITVPDTVTINGRQYRVASIGKKALYKKTRLKTLIIGRNVSSIGSKACYGCKKLKTIKILGTGLRKAGSGAMKNISKKAVVRAPKSKIKVYRRLLKKAGLKGKKQKIKAL